MDLSEMFNTVVDSLKSQVVEYNMYRYKPHPKQETFHSSPATQRLFIGGNRCLAGGTKVIMANGSIKPIEDIIVGDYVIAGNGSKTKVIATHVNGKKDCYTYEVGRYQDIVNVTCTADHKFLGARESHGRLEDFYMQPITNLFNVRGRHKIQRSTGTNLGGYRESKALMLGLMLGDGYFGEIPSRLQFTNSDKLLLNQVGLFKPAYGIQNSLKNASDYFDFFKQLGLIGKKAKDKIIPSIVWNWDEYSIKELVAGLLSTDGSVFKNKDGENHVAFSTSSKNIAYSFRALMGIRLGIWGSTVTEDGRGNYSITYGTLEALSKISSLPLVGIKAKKILAALPNRDSYASRVGVKSLTYAGNLMTYDITVDHPDHNFMLANGLITSNSGKTVAGIIEDLWWVTRRHPYRRIPSDVAIRGRALGDGFENGTINRVLLPEFKRWVIPSDLINGSWEDSWSNSEHMLRLANGSFIEFKSYDQELQKHAGTSRHFIHFDEEPPQSIFAESMSRLIDTSGSWWMTMTPLNGMNWVYDDLYLPGLAKKIKDLLVVQVISLENPHIDSEALETLFAHLSEEEKRQRINGEFAERGGRVFPEFSSAHIKKGTWYPQDPNYYRVYMSLDHGFRNPTAILWHAVDPYGNVITFGEIYKTEKIVKDYAKMIKRFEMQHNLKVWSRVADPALKQRQGVTGTSIVQEYGINGIYLNVESIPRDVKTGLDRMRSYMQLGTDKKPKWRIMEEQCPNLIKELNRLSWKDYDSDKARNKANALEEVKKKNDHAFDSSRYFFTQMPDLSPDQLWHPPVEVEFRLRSFVDTLTEMSHYSKQKVSWKPSGRGYSEEDSYYSDGLEWG